MVKLRVCSSPCRSPRLAYLIRIAAFRTRSLRIGALGLRIQAPGASYDAYFSVVQTLSYFEVLNEPTRGSNSRPTQSGPSTTTAFPLMARPLQNDVEALRRELPEVAVAADDVRMAQSLHDLQRPYYSEP